MGASSCISAVTGPHHLLGARTLICPVCFLPLRIKHHASQTPRGWHQLSAAPTWLICLSPRVTSEGMVSWCFLNCVYPGGLVQRPMLHLCGNRAVDTAEGSGQTPISPPSVQQQSCAVDMARALDRWAQLQPRLPWLLSHLLPRFLCRPSRGPMSHPES